ncbi:hypothetical protein BKA83DRAFT_4127230 [Pisolithus microcarpus]|nr:hypothetical protein BKA83DRAFT_4127230 [Pisolithus microcarpus]
MLSNHLLLLLPSLLIELGQLDLDSAAGALDKSKGKARVTKRRHRLFHKGDDVVPNIKLTEPTKADELTLLVEKAIAEVMLGYALIISKTALFLQNMQIVEIMFPYFSVQICRYLSGVSVQKGHHNKGSAKQSYLNAMILAVSPSAIDTSSLQPVQLGAYKNSVKWAPEAGKLEASFLNGNHHREVLKLMEMQLTHIQFKKASQEKEQSYRMNNHQQYLLDMAIERSTKELDKNGSWLVQFVDDSKLENHPKLAEFLDNDNDKLYLVLNILVMLNNEESRKDLQEVHHWEAPTFAALMGKGKGHLDAGFTARQCESWVASIRGVQILLCGYVLDVFIFLEAPIEMEPLNLTIKAAKDEKRPGLLHPLHGM